MFFVVVLGFIAMPAVAWALTSPKTAVDTPAEGAEVNGTLNIGGSASHRVGVAGVRLVVRNLDDNTYWNGSTWQEDFIRVDIDVHDPGESETRWSYSLRAKNLKPANYRARAFAYSVEGNGDGFGGDWNEFVYTGRFDPTLYDTEITAPADGGSVSGPIVVTGMARSTEGVESVRVVIRNRSNNRYWNADLNGWDATFTTVQADLSSSNGGTQAAWTVAVPEDRVSPGTYFARAWVRTAEGHGDPIGRGRTTFTVTDDEQPVTPPPTAAPTTIAATTTIATTEPTAKQPSTTAQEPTTTERQTTTAPKLTTTTQRVTTTTKATTTTTERQTTTTTTAAPSGGCSGRSVASLEPCAGVLIGASGDFTDDNGRQVNKQESFMARERQLNAEFDIYHNFLQWNDLVSKTWPNANSQALADDGRILFINWKSASGHPRDWAAIANGSYDADVAKAARQVAAFGDEVFITFFHEPEDNIRDASGGDPAKVQQYLDDYSAATRHLHDMFDAAGADNAVWVWDMQGYLPNWELYYLNGLYPGDDVIDWIAYNPYNWHECNPGSKWRSFTEVASPFYDWLNEGGNRPSTSKPVMLGEFGTEENQGAVNSNQTKAEWLEEATRVLPSRFPRLKATVYFDTEGRNSQGVPQFCDWALDSSQGSMNAMRDMLNAPALNPVWPTR